MSLRECYAGVAETAIYVAGGACGRGVGKALIRKQVMAADEAGLWTLQSAIFTENRASIARLDGVWHDTVFIERRA